MYKILMLIRLLSKNCPTAPPSQISGYATDGENQGNGKVSKL